MDLGDDYLDSQVADLFRIIGEEIVDETDTVTDNRSRRIAKRQGTAAVMRELHLYGFGYCSILTAALFL